MGIRSAAYLLIGFGAGWCLRGIVGWSYLLNFRP
jgi:hypothetical protein